MALRLVDLRGSTATGTNLIPFEASTFHAGDPEIGEPLREVRINQKFLTFPGEVTNADVDQIAAHMTPARKFGVFGLDRDHGPILVATSPDTNESHFEMVDPQLYRPEIGITDWEKQNDTRLAQLALTKPIQIIPDADRYETWFKKWGQTDAAHFAKGEMAATMVSWWEAKALAMFMAGAKGLSGASDLLSSDQFDMLVQGLKFMTRTGELTDPSGALLRAFALPQIVPVNDPRFQALQNGIRPNTTWNWTRTGWNNKDGGPFSLDLEKLIFVLRGGSWYNDDPQLLRAAYRDTILSPNFRDINLGFRVAVAAVHRAERPRPPRSACWK